MGVKEHFNADSISCPINVCSYIKCYLFKAMKSFPLSNLKWFLLWQIHLKKFISISYNLENITWSLITKYFCHRLTWKAFNSGKSIALMDQGDKCVKLLIFSFFPKIKEHFNDELMFRMMKFLRKYYKCWKTHVIILKLKVNFRATLKLSAL